MHTRRTARIALTAAVGPALMTCVMALAGCGTGPAATSGGPGGPGGSAAGTGSASPGQVVTVPPSGTVTGVVSSPPGPVPAGPRLIVAGPSGQVRVTAANNGATVVLRPGQRILVVLGGQGAGGWDRPRVTGSRAGVLHLVSARGGFPASGPATASYRAQEAGRAAITSMSDFACLHTVPACEIAQQLWRVIVSVRAG